MLHQGLGLELEFLWFQTLEGDEHRWQKGNASLPLRLSGRRLGPLPLHAAGDCALPQPRARRSRPAARAPGQAQRLAGAPRDRAPLRARRRGHGAATPGDRAARALGARLSPRAARGALDRRSRRERSAVRRARCGSDPVPPARCRAVTAHLFPIGNKHLRRRPCTLLAWPPTQSVTFGADRTNFAQPN